MSRSVILWFRRDLRLSDNTALNAAFESGAAVLPVFIFDPQIVRGERGGSARMAFMLDGLRALDEALHKLGTGLVLRTGEPLSVLEKLLNDTDASAIYFNRDYSPYARRRDRAIAEALGPDRVRTFHDLLLHPPTTILTLQGTPYTVYTPFKRNWVQLPKGEVRTVTGRFHTLEGVQGEALPSLSQLGHANSIPLPPAGEAAAQARLEAFVRERLGEYHEARNIVFPVPWQDTAQGTSCLSPYLRLGMLSARQAYHAADEVRRTAETSGARRSAETWISELAWRDFYIHILYHFPHVYNSSFRPEYDNVAFLHDSTALDAWKAGMTGYPIVDAAMRQMLQTGWMHNRARMIVANFLTKDLLHYWRLGDVYFMQHLIDGDPAANNGGWQWAAGTGTDAQPYFRMFNPVTQSKKCDPTGEYIRHFVPELRDVEDRYLHAPWERPTPPRAYPRPIVDHGFARDRMLTAFRAIRLEASADEDDQETSQ